MRKAVKLLLLGGVVGAAVVAVKSLRSEEQVENLPVQAAKSAGMGAAAGGVVGLLLDVRSRRKETKRRRFMKKAMAGHPRHPRLKNLAQARCRRPPARPREGQPQGPQGGGQGRPPGPGPAEHLAEATREAGQKLAS